MFDLSVLPKIASTKRDHKNVREQVIHPEATKLKSAIDGKMRRVDNFGARSGCVGEFIRPGRSGDRVRHLRSLTLLRQD